jgi:uncharacterized protein with von Willebrand factor type A (vWA) domain
MEDRILKFVSALRASGIRISLAESADAFDAVNHMGVKNRETFRLSLRTTLVKDANDIPVFEELFPLFFGEGDTPPMMNLSDDLTPEEAKMLAQALRQFNDQLRKMLEKLINGQQLSQEELDRLSRMVGLNQAGDLRYREWMVQRMKKALRFREVQEALRELAELMAQMGIAENMSQKPPEDALDNLMDRPFSALSDRDMEHLRKEVQRLAAILRTRVSLRQKRAKTGQLDAKATIRANLKHGNVPIVIKHRDRSLKPKLVVICDVSTSMRSCSELMLSLLYAMQDQISKTFAFAFIDHLEFISPDFETREASDAVAQVLERMPAGYYNTDLGYSLQNFTQDFLHTIDGRTTFIIVGDGRNNYNDPRLDLFTAVTRRSRRTIWLNPEAATLWGTGDSDMLKYAPNCDVVLQAGTLAELTAAVDRLLLA